MIKSSFHVNLKLFGCYKLLQWGYIHLKSNNLWHSRSERKSCRYFTPAKRTILLFVHFNVNWQCVHAKYTLYRIRDEGGD